MFPFEDGSLQKNLPGAWRQYGDGMGVPPVRMAASIQRVPPQSATRTEDYLHLLHAAGFQRGTRYFFARCGGLTA